MMPVLVLLRFPTALFSVLDEPGVPAGPRLLPVVPWLLALPAFAPGAQPVPFTVAPLLSVVPPVDDVPPVEFEDTHYRQNAGLTEGRVRATLACSRTTSGPSPLST